MQNKVTYAICGHELPLKQSVRAMAEKNGRWAYFDAKCYFESEDKRIKEALSKKDGEGDVLSN